MTGPLILAADPVLPLEAATKHYVDQTLGPAGIGVNRVINGNFAINQRVYVTNTALAAAAYGHDRWKAGAAGCTYTFTAALPDTTITITAARATLTQIIEAGMIEGGVYTLSWTGTAQAQRFWQGTPAGVYAASPLTTASLAVGTDTVVEFNSGTVTRVKLEIGSVATPYNRQSLAKSMIDCQRYYQIGQMVYTFSGQVAGNNIYLMRSMPVTMRAAPTMNVLGTPNINNISGFGFASNTTDVWTTGTVGVVGGINIIHVVLYERGASEHRPTRSPRNPSPSSATRTARSSRPTPTTSTTKPS